MAPAKKRGAANKSKAKAGSKAPKKEDAISLLKADHREVEALFDEFEKMKNRDNPKREEIARQICEMLTAHATIEEEIFYPSLRDAFDEDDLELVDEAEVEHQSAKQLISEIEDMSIDDELFDAKVKVLGEYIKHHVKEEENEMFKAAKKANLDLDQLGQELKERKEELLGMDQDEEQRARTGQQSGLFRI